MALNFFYTTGCGIFTKRAADTSIEYVPVVIQGEHALYRTFREASEAVHDLCQMMAINSKIMIDAVITSEFYIFETIDGKRVLQASPLAVIINGSVYKRT